MQRSYFGRLQQWIRTGYRMPAQKIVLRPENHWKYVTYLTLIRSKSIVVYLGRRRTEKTHQQRVGRCESHGLNVLLESGTRSTHLRSCWRRTFWAHTVIKMMWCDGLTENAGRENDGPAKLQGMKLQDMKMTDKKWRQGVKWRGKSTVSTELIGLTLQWIVQIFKPTTL